MTPPNRLSAEERYRRDIAFRALVDTIEAQCHAGNYTPTEMREAVMLGVCHFEMRRAPRPYSLVVGQVLETDGPVGPPSVVLVDGVRYRIDPEVR
jgi:hypothetical protein